MRILCAEVNVNKFSPLSFTQFPVPISRKNAVLNVKNRDNHYFAWDFMATLLTPTGRISDVESYSNNSRYHNFTGVGFAVKLSDIKRFKTLNDISFNVYDLESKFKNNKIVYKVVGSLRYTGR